MGYKIPIGGKRRFWVMCCGPGLWYPSTNKDDWIEAVVSREKVWNPLAKVKYCTITTENDDIILWVDSDQIGYMNRYSGELYGCTNSRFEVKWNKEVLKSGQEIPNEALQELCKIEQFWARDTMLELFLRTHKLTRETKEDLLLEMCKTFLLDYEED